MEFVSGKTGSGKGREVMTEQKHPGVVDVERVYGCSQKRIAELEKQLVEAQKYKPVLLSELSHANKQAEKLEKQLADYKGKLDSTQWEHDDSLKREAVLEAKVTRRNLTNHDLEAENMLLVEALKKLKAIALKSKTGTIWVDTVGKIASAALEVK